MSEQFETSAQTKKVKLAVIAVLVAIVIIVGVIAGIKVAAPMKKYNSAIDLMKAEKYEDAIEAFKLLDGYKDSADKIKECETLILDNMYTAALQLMQSGKYEEAIAAFSELDYKDSAAKIEECKLAIIDGKYNDALALMESGNYYDAGAILKTLDYKDSAEKYEECRATAPYDFTEIGDIITFGKFEQDYNKENGAEPITWRVLDKQDGKVLVITEKALEKMPFFAIYWKRSTIGAYLDSAFLYDFTPAEKEMIVKTTVTADAHPDYIGTNQGADTVNKLFLLSVIEAEKYFKDDEDRICYATDYLMHVGDDPAHLSFTESDKRCDWWLRTACNSWSSGAFIANVDPNGRINASTHNCRMGLRPACWIQLEAN